MRRPFSGAHSSFSFFATNRACNQGSTMSEQHVHRFAQAVIPLFENCEFCGEKIVCTNESSRSYHVAVFNPAYQCSQCLKFCHKQCCDTADSICPCSGVPETSRNQELLFTAFPVNHSLAENTVRFYEDYMKPTFMKKDDKSTQFQSTRSIRNHSNRDDDSDFLPVSHQTAITSYPKKVFSQ